MSNRMGTLNNNKYEILLKEREWATNKSNSRVMAAVTVCILTFATLPLIGAIPRYYTPISYYLCIAAAMITGIGTIVCLAGKYRKSYHKYVMIASAELAATLMYAALGPDALIMFANPMLLSGRYGKSKICLATYLVSMVLNCIAVINFVFMDAGYYHYASWLDEAADVVATILPMLAMTTVMAVIVYGMVASDMKNWTQILESKEEVDKVETEFRTGAELQINSLPKDFNIAPGEEFSVYASIMPSRETSGDFYDFFMAGDGRAVFVIGDVSDKGVPAALYMMSARNTIRTLCRVMHDPAEVMNEANRILLETSDRAFVTLFVAFVDPETGAGEYVNAGHVQPIICHRNGACGFLKSGPQPIAGAFDFVKYKSSPIQMDKGTLLLLYTDGLNEAVSNRGEEFGTRRLCDMIRENPDASPEEICRKTVSAVNDFADSSRHFDDRTMLAVRWKKETGISEKRTLPVAEESITKMIDSVNEILHAGNCPENTLRNIDVVIDEIGANLVDYSQADTVKFEYECGENHIRMTFTDNGIKFNPGSSRAYETRDVLAPGGLGIHFIRTLMDEVCYGYENGHNIYVITKYWNQE